MTGSVSVEFSVECLVLASGAPLALNRTEEILGLSTDEVRAAVAALNDRNIAEGRSFTVVERGGLLVAQTRAPFVDLVRSLTERQTRLSPALLHTLAAVAYRQPVTRAEIDLLRGVDSAHALGRLIELGLVRMAGRADKPGRPLLYRTTEQFLIHFGLPSLDDLPSAEELRSMMEGSHAQPVPVSLGTATGA